MITVRWVGVIDKYKFIELALEECLKTFVIHILALKAFLLILTVYFTRKFLLAGLEQDKVWTEISMNYQDFITIFSFDLAIDFSNCSRMTEHAIELVKGKLSVYSMICS